MKKLIIFLLIIGMVFSFTPMTYANHSPEYGGTTVAELVSFATGGLLIMVGALPDVIVPVDSGGGGGGCTTMMCI